MLVEAFTPLGAISTLLSSGIEIRIFVTVLIPNNMYRTLLKQVNLRTAPALMLLITISFLFLANNLEIGIEIPH